MKLIKEFILLVVIVLMPSVNAQNPSTSIKKKLNVTKAGTMIEQLTEEEANLITDLEITGKINAIDFRHLRDEFKNLQTLDLSNVTISAYVGKSGTFPGDFYIYPPNCIPAYAFCQKNYDGTFKGKEKLTKIILPSKIKNIEDAAFKACPNLKICQIEKETAPNLLPEALSDSVTAIFVPDGCAESYRSIPKWKDFAIIEGNPTIVNLSIPNTETLESVLQKVNIQPKNINFLTIEGKMDATDYRLIRDYMANLVSIDLQECESTSLPEYTFAQKKVLLSVTLPKNLKTIGQRAFSGCTRLSRTLILPTSVTSIEYGAFMGCEKLKNVIVTGNNLTALGDDLFSTEMTPSRLIYKK